MPTEPMSCSALPPRDEISRALPPTPAAPFVPLIDLLRLSQEEAATRRQEAVELADHLAALGAQHRDLNKRFMALENYARHLDSQANTTASHYQELKKLHDALVEQHADQGRVLDSVVAARDESLAAQLELARHHEELGELHQQLSERFVELEARTRSLDQQADTTGFHYGELQKLHDVIALRHSQQKEELQAALEAQAEAKARTKAILDSRTWRCFAPLRALADFVRGNHRANPT